MIYLHFKSIDWFLYFGNIDLQWAENSTAYDFPLFCFYQISGVFGKSTRAHHIQVSSVIRQKGESQKQYYNKTKPTKFSEKRTFLTP